MAEFKFKPFEEMTPQDYETIGFMSGLEVHQQLLTEKKLFCRCPAGVYTDEYHAEILRHMRPTLSELGEYDGTALMEFKTKKNIIYKINRNTVCTYEMDDTPPFHCNSQALDIAFEVAMLYNAHVVDEVHIARKQYLDGSIPTGFQRTAITSVGGKVPYKDRMIDIIQMSIEEDSCREASDVGHRRVYLTDRLGMPLIETVTAPQMKTPQEVAEVNDILRRIVRSTGKVRTGIGAARQDVNVSVKGGTRIEIKGVPSIKRIPLLTYNEAMRQWNLLKIREELKSRGITADTFEAKIDDITNIVKKTSYLPISYAIGEGKFVNCVTLKGFKGILTHQTQTDTYFAKEISDRVRVIACLTTLPNIIHSDSSEVTLSSAEGQKIRKAVGATENDTLVIVWGDAQDVAMASSEVVIRAKEATIGVPAETRQALKDGTNGFERILPGPERMYPDTDLPPITITKERLADIRAGLPEYYWEREAFYHSLNLPKDVIKALAVSKYAKLFNELVKDLKIDAKLASIVLVQFMKKLARRRVSTKNLCPNCIKEIFLAYKNGTIVKDAIFEVLEKTAITGSYDVAFCPKPANKEEFKAVFAKMSEKMKRINFYHPEKKNEYLFGMIMDELRGRMNGSEAEKYLNELINQEAK
jgi:glutamyl-tRNA(Gln) amidotransferase subunit E